MQVSSTGCVDDEPVRRIGGGDRRVTLERPEREPVEGFRVGGGLRVPDDEARHQRLRLGGGHTNAQAARRAAASRAKTTRRRPSRPVRTSGASTGGAAAPNVLRNQSVGQLGRKSETTRAIAGLHFEIGTFSGPAAD